MSCVLKTRIGVIVRKGPVHLIACGFGPNPGPVAPGDLFDNIFYNNKVFQSNCVLNQASWQMKFDSGFWDG